MVSDTPQLQNLLISALEDYPEPSEIGINEQYQTVDDLSGMQRLIFSDLPKSLNGLLLDREFEEFEITGQIGTGTIADIPYVAIRRTDETHSTRMGLYVVYLFDITERAVYLTLNQGAAEAQRASGRSGVVPNSQDILSSHASQYRELIETPSDFTAGPTELTSELRNAQQYNHGSVLYKKYTLEGLRSISNEQCLNDCLRMVQLYTKLLDHLYAKPRLFVSEETDVWALSSGLDDEMWDLWRKYGIAALRESDESPDRTETAGNILRNDVSVGDIVIAGTRSNRIDIVYGIGRVTSAYTDTAGNDINETFPDGSQIMGGIEVDWWPVGNTGAGISINCRKRTNKLFAQEKIEQFPADLSEFIGAILRRLDATNLSADLGATLEDAAERLDLDIVEQYDPERVRLVEIRSWRDDDDPNREPLYDTFEEWAVQQEAVFEEDVDLTPDNLVFPDGVNPMERAAVALRSGKHVIFTGPPGTGKTEVAGELAERFVNTHELVTATADWSTFDTIGGYRPERDQTLQFHPGVFLDRFRSDSQGTPANEWLIIDELNRADIDKAFGSLFSALTGESVTLPFEASNGDAITLVGDPDHAAETTISPARYYMSDDWRLLATMNTADKTSLYQMSFAFMRRFAFVPVPIPDDITPDLVQEYASCWVDDQILESTNNAESGTDLLSEDDAVTIANVWQAINGVQPIGPAIIEDVLSHLQSQGTFDLTDPIIMYVMPQLEGCSKAEKQSFLSQLAQLDEEADQSILTPGELVTFAADYFDIDPDSVNWQTTDG